MVRPLLLVSLCVAASACATHGPYRPERLTLEISDCRIERGAGEAVMLAVRFKNIGRVPAYVLAPQRGSYQGLLSPDYDVEVVGPDGTRLEAPDYDGGLRAVYDKKSMRAIAPGATEAMRIRTVYTPDRPGLYRVRLGYAVHPGRYPGPSYSAPNPSAPSMPMHGARYSVRYREWPRGVFVGRLVSNQIEISVE
jgi:hypothetical protein